MSSTERNAIRVAVFLGGAMLMALEVSAFRIIGKTFGSALRETTAVIAVFLTAMSIGYWAGGRVGDRWPQTRTLIAALLGAAVTLLCVPWLDALVSPRIAASGIDFATHAFIATAALFAIPTLFFSALSPIAIRLFAPTTGHSGSIAGSISAISTAGSIAGSVITAFFLIDWLASIARTVLFVSLAACVTAGALMLASTSRTAFRRYGIAVAVAAVLVIIPTTAFVHSTRLDQMLLTKSEWTMLFVGDSPYHHIVVRDLNGKIRELAFNTGVQTRMKVADPFGAGALYSDSLHISRLIRPNIRRVLVIGLGGGTAAKQFSKYYPDVTVDAVEVDPMVVDLAKRFFRVEPSERLRVHTGDGRAFLKRSREYWDLIIVDVYTTNRYGDTIPAHMVTREFFDEVAGRLAPGGMLHFHCAFGQTKLLPAIQKTIASVFGYVLTASGEILASDTALITSKEVIVERARSSPAAGLPNLSSYIDWLGPNPAVAADIPLLTDDYSPVDALVREKR